jgi:hypothetical protein
MDSSVSAKDEIWFLLLCHHVSNAVHYILKRLGGGRSLDVTGNQLFVHFKRVKDSFGKGEPYHSPILINEFSTYMYIYIYTYIHIYTHTYIHVSFLHGSTALVGHSLLIVEVSISHSVGLLWTSDRPVAETST